MRNPHFYVSGKRPMDQYYDTVDSWLRNIRFIKFGVLSIRFILMIRIYLILSTQNLIKSNVPQPDNIYIYILSSPTAFINRAGFSFCSFLLLVNMMLVCW